MSPGPGLSKGRIFAFEVSACTTRPAPPVVPGTADPLMLSTGTGSVERAVAVAPPEIAIAIAIKPTW